MAVAARLNTTYWGLLKQPDNQKLTTSSATSNVDSGLTGTFLLLSELTPGVFCGRGCASRSELPLGRVFISRWTNCQRSKLAPLKAAVTWAFGGALRALRAILTFAVGALAGIIVALILWAALLATLHHFGVELAPLLAKLDRFLGIREFAGEAPTEPELPTPLGSQIVFATVLGLVILGWLIRGVSYFVQRRWRPVQG